MDKQIASESKFADVGLLYSSFTTFRILFTFEKLIIFFTKLLLYSENTQMSLKLYNLFLNL